MRVSDVKCEAETLGDYEFRGEDVIRCYLFLWVGKPFDIIFEVDVVVFGFGGEEQR